MIVRSFIHLNKAGTCIGDFNELQHEASLTFKPKQLLIDVRVNDLSTINQNIIGKVLNVISRERIKINLLQISATTITICADNSLVDKTELIQKLSTAFEVSFKENLELVTIKNYTEKLFIEYSNQEHNIIEQRNHRDFQIVRKLTTN